MLYETLTEGLIPEALKTIPLGSLCHVTETLAFTTADPREGRTYGDVVLCNETVVVLDIFSHVNFLDEKVVWIEVFSSRGIIRRTLPTMEDVTKWFKRLA